MQKSNGCGVCKIEKALQKHFNMKDPSDRKLWLKEDALEETEYDNITDHLSGADLEAYAYEFIVDATTEGKMLIKAIAVEDYGDGASDAVNIKNARKEYVIPGSSLKGAVRNHMEQIAERLHQKTVIKDTFGSAGNGEDLGQSGNIIFRDTIIGDKEDNDNYVVFKKITGKSKELVNGNDYGTYNLEDDSFKDKDLSVVIIFSNGKEKFAFAIDLKTREVGDYYG